MKAYQVHLGDTDKHDRHYYELKATFLNKDKAIEYASKLVAEVPLYDDDLIECEWNDKGNYKLWMTHGWSYHNLCLVQEIDITE